MMPNRLVPIDRIPVTINGKLDVKNLPRIETSGGSSHGVCVPPDTEIQMKLCEIWAELLSIPQYQIGIRDDFFNLGGDSLLVIKLSFLITSTFHQVVGVGEIFLHKTIEGLAHRIQHDSLHKIDALRPLNQSSDYAQNWPLSLAQERLLFIHDMEEGNCNAFNIQLTYKVSKVICLEFLQKCIHALVARHESLRTRFPMVTNSGCRKQLVVPVDEIELIFHINNRTVCRRSDLDSELAKEARHCFQLDTELPLRTCIYDILEDDSNHWYFCAIFHHICFDGHSGAIFERDLNRFLATYSTADSQLPELSVHYKEFGDWQRSLLTGQSLRRLSNYWVGKLKGVEPLNLLPDIPRPPKFEYDGKELYFELDKRKLKEFAKELKVSVFSLLLSALGLTLSIFTNQRDILLGTPVSNRNRAEFEHVIGFFVNLLVLKLTVEREMTLKEFIQTVSEESIQSQIHQDMPFEKIVKEVVIDTDLSRHPLVQVIFSLNPFNPPSMKSDSKLQMVPYTNKEDGANSHSPAKYDLTLTMTETELGFSGSFNYATTLFHESTVASILETFVHIVSLYSPENGPAKVSEINLMDHVSYQKVMAVSGKIAGHQSMVECETQSRQGTTLHHIFEEQVLTISDKTAVIFGSLELSYGLLNSKANQLAYLLQSSSTPPKPDDLICLLLDKSELMIVSILGVWKAGSAYVPIDPSYPNERIQFIFQETHPNFIITNSCYSTRLVNIAPSGSQQIIIDAENLLEGLPFHNLSTQVNGHNLSYVIYTSGTTGVPKGVMVEHRGLVNLRQNLILSYCSEMQEPHRVLLLSNYVFDFSIEQLMLSILNSGTLIIPPVELILDDTFYNYLNQSKLTYLSGTPTLLNQMNLARLTHLQQVTVAGEIFTGVYYDKIRTEGYHGRIVNAYGVTETSVYNMIRTFSKSSDSFQNSFNQLFSNTQAIVLNDNLKPVPVRAIGCLYLTGSCLARGYLNRPELNATTFYPNPFCSEGDNCRIYKTGDLVRQFSNGDLEYLGRIDSQVKIRGLRVEPLEIQSVLSTHGHIRDCAVVANVGNYNLAAFFVPQQGIIPPSENQLASFLGNKLPSYMIPSRFFQLTELPTTINGKLDTLALSAVAGTTDEGRKRSYAPPRNRFENQLCTMWSTLLGIDSVGIDDDFFKLGGDSIQSLHIASQIRNELKRAVSVKDVFHFKTIRQLYENVLKDNATEEINAGVGEQGILRGELPLLPIQKWFFEKSLKFPNQWNQTFTIKTLPLDLERLQAALNSLVQYHDALRIKFKKVEGKPIVQYYDPKDFEIKIKKLEILGLTEAELKIILSREQSVFDLENGPLFCVAYLGGFVDGTARIWWAIHHLLIDTVSWRIIKDDLEVLYSGGSLEMKGSSYREFGLAMERFSCPVSERNYWTNIQRAVPSFNAKLRLLTGPFREVLHDTFSLTLEQTRILLRNCPGVFNAQITELLLTALVTALEALTGENTNYVTLEGHGREEIETGLDLSKTVGWFTSMFPIKLTRAGHLRETIASTREYILAVQNNGIGYGATFGYNSPPLPLISFNYLGQFEQRSKHNRVWEFDELGTGLHVGLNQKSNDMIIDATGLCANGVLSFEFESQLGQQEMEKFLTKFKASLEEIIEEGSEAVGVPGYYNPEPYFEFNKGKSEVVLFILPPGEGGAESYFNNLVKGLPEVSLVVFNNFYLDKKDDGGESTFEELATIYLSYVRTITPNGPFNFLGWSFGGVLALEMTRQLKTVGITVANLILIDSYFNVKKACEEIGRPGVRNIIDPINYDYCPQLEELAINVVLFKATVLNDMHKSPDQLLLYTYYMKSGFNNLETLVSSARIQIHPMLEDNHNSWAKNPDEVKKICILILSKIG